MLLQYLVIPGLCLLEVLDFLILGLHFFNLGVEIIPSLSELGLIHFDRPLLLGKLCRRSLSRLLLELFLIEVNIVCLELLMHGLRLEGEIVPLYLDFLELLILLFKE